MCWQTLTSYPNLKIVQLYRSFATDICDDKEPILHICDNLLPIFHMFEDLVPVLHMCEDLIAFFHM